MPDYTVVWWNAERQQLMVETSLVDTPEEAPGDAGVKDGQDFIVFEGSPAMVHEANYIVFDALWTYLQKGAGRATATPIRGLTLWQPWSWLIAKGWNEGRRPLTQEEVNLLPSEARVEITWLDGSGPHEYRIVKFEHGRSYAISAPDWVALDCDPHAALRHLQRRGSTPIHSVGPSSPWTVVRRVVEPHAPKRIENRSRVLTKTRRMVFLHAGLTFDQYVEDDLRAAGFTVPREYAKGAIEAVAILTGRVFRSLGEVPADQAFWWSGPLAMELGEVVALAEPVPCRGKQGLWMPPPEVVSRVRDQVDLDAFLGEASR